jgi:signal transduction histidine kinase
MLRPLAVETLMWAVANDWRQIAIAAGLQLQMALDKRGMRVPGDESRLRLAIGNIVDNAIKYTLPGGAISLEIKDEVDGTVHLRIRDNGVGIAPADMEHLFMPFYRGTPTTADGEIIRVPGMGQGLHLARQIIEAHGGRIKVKSRPGVGTAVYVALPLTAGEALPLADTVDSATLLIVPEALDMEAVWRQ